jgi:hypothetical protein
MYKYKPAFKWKFRLWTINKLLTLTVYTSLKETTTYIFIYTYMQKQRKYIQVLLKNIAIPYRLFLRKAGAEERSVLVYGRPGCLCHQRTVHC